MMIKSTRNIFETHTGNLIHKWDHYFEIYDRYFHKYMGQEVIVLEIGVSQGGSIDLWKKYFGDKLRYFGIDINPKCKQFEDENVTIFIGSQDDAVFLEQVKKQLPDLDILIDDGGHSMKQQIVTFEVMYDKIKDNGIYFCEDNHTSYWHSFGGGMKRRGTYIEYIKNLVDVMHLWYAGKNTFIKNHLYMDKIYSIHFYNSIVIIEKRKITPPFDIKTGNFTVGYVEEKNVTTTQKISYLYYGIKNRIRSFFYK